ncbi:MAG: hypothetical protein KGL95_10845, partial [Patescibacteria group bacterium]|nr:hypothetical protein [Patescibacteria group bacterium]
MSLHELQPLRKFSWKPLAQYVSERNAYVDRHLTIARYEIPSLFSREVLEKVPSNHMDFAISIFLRAEYAVQQLHIPAPIQIAYLAKEQIPEIAQYKAIDTNTRQIVTKETLSEYLASDEPVPVSIEDVG